MKLAFRPTKLKIKVGVIADAALGPFPIIDPLNTFDRYFAYSERTPYELMWHLIGAFYKDNDWSELSNERLEQKCNQVVSQGSNSLVKGKEYRQYFETVPEAYQLFRLVTKQRPTVNQEQIKEASQRWVKYGWLNYEEKRAEKLKTATKIARWGALIAGGGSIFGL
tara:strand:+ start:116 stop:613 length:498 start_codon:yes stop_codon:yes gene_type:complete